MDIWPYFRLRNYLATALQPLIMRFFFRSFGIGARIVRPKKIRGSDKMSIGARVYISDGAWLEVLSADNGLGEMEIGCGTYIGNDAHIVALRSVVIGVSVLIADKVYIGDYVHGHQDVSLPIIEQPLEARPHVVIGDGTWVGENAVIVGATIGKNCLIAANSVVTRDVPDYSIARGNPAVVTRRVDSVAPRGVQANDVT